MFPEFAPPLVEIQTEAPGLSTEEVESLVTVPLENALNGTPDLKTIRSKSVLGLSSIVLIFQDGTDLMESRQLVGERLAIEASRLPAVAQPPVILSPLSSTSRVLKIGIWSDKDENGNDVMSQMEMSELARWTIRPRLMAVAGRGQRRHLGPTRSAVPGAGRSRTAAGPQPDAGRRRTGRRRRGTGVGRRLHRHAESATAGAARLARSSRPTTWPVRWSPFATARRCVLGDVAEVKEGHPPPIGDAIINDVPGLLLIVEKQPTGNTLDVTRNVEAALEEMKPGLKGVQVDSTIFRPATFIEMSLENLGWAMAIGCVLVIVILVAFLWDWRTALISTTAIPLSLVAAALVLRQAGVTINTMVLAGLIIALGEVVDDAIIDVENIVRRLRLNREAGNPRSAFRVVLDASIEVRSAVVYGSFTVMLVIMPVFFLEGLAGSFFRPLAMAYVLAIFASLDRGADRHARHVAAAASRPIRSAPRVAADHAAEDALSSRLAVADPTPGCVDRRAGRPVGRDVGDRPVSGRGVSARLPGIRLPDALGREARHVDRGDGSHHRAGQQGTASGRRACGISARTSAGPKSPTKWWARTSRNCGSASIATWTIRAKSPRSRKSSTAIRASIAIC